MLQENLKIEAWQQKKEEKCCNFLRIFLNQRFGWGLR